MTNMKFQRSEQCNSVAGTEKTAYATEFKRRRKGERGVKQAKMSVRITTTHVSSQQFEYRTPVGHSLP